MPRPPQPVTATAPELPGRAITRQSWRDLTFVHWRVAPDVVAPLLPPGTRPDVHDGASWVGLVPFRMVGVGAGFGPGVPWLGSFPETNVRLYSVDEQGRRGVVFLTLEASRLAFVLGTRAVFALPYTWARMRVSEADGVLTYTSRRRWPGPRDATTHVVVRPGEALAPGDAEAEFLTARWGLHTRAFGRTLYVPNRHETWPLQAAELVTLDDRLVATCGIPGTALRPPDSVLFSRGVRTDFGPPVDVRTPLPA
ncbi:YqjF family protein [Cellulomonas dongxiuzhuiae]|uniref:DUF2071 domain-containing protein n=1 Tax=Cellulomonas dongxiuzhuiae TaxID=2819979 RepID=A0ABX8GK19_9CELL|nr:DUF2071 domain-containing protein [Cellulomonas dongxiuzhuiae]MBO3095452.1 DUF2071 domain-containing protein [Cellulomonas dongxiuzhuiae]QWC16434.1 DUF2071 domain-containing protein [Cellulomonas dongxiuzhuiae]